MKSVCGLDVHRDSVYLCILSELGELVEKVFGVLTYQLEEMRDLMLHHHVVEVSMESTFTCTIFAFLMLKTAS